MIFQEDFSGNYPWPVSEKSSRKENASICFVYKSSATKGLKKYIKLRNDPLEFKEPHG